MSVSPILLHPTYDEQTIQRLLQGRNHRVKQPKEDQAERQIIADYLRHTKR